MRYPKYVKISVHELSQLLASWNLFTEDPEELGEHILGTHYPDIVRDIDIQSNINVTPQQLYNLIWYYKHCVLERLSFHHKKLPKNYNKLMRRLMKQVPLLFIEDADGEVRLKENKEVLKDYWEDSDEVQDL